MHEKAQHLSTEILTGDDWNDGFAEGRFLWEDAHDQHVRQTTC